MQEIEVNIGDTFIIETPHNSKHLYTIIAVISDDKYLLVNTTTSNTQPNEVTDCIIEPGEGVPSFIKKQFTVAYRFAREVRVNEIKSCIKQNKWLRTEKFSDQHVLRMQEKGSLSSQLKKKYKNILKNILKAHRLGL